MLIRNILKDKGSVVHTISPQATLADACRRLIDFNCGSLVVCENDQMVGIITERDLLRSMVNDQGRMESIQVQARMSVEVITASPDNEIEGVMGLMTEKRIRHLPIFEAGQLSGIISIGDLVKAHHDRLCMENEYLKHYIHS